jgi:FkbM family methyltransferase
MVPGNTDKLEEIVPKKRSDRKKNPNKPQLLSLKRVMKKFLCHPWVGILIDRLYRGRIPYRGIKVDTTLLPGLPPSIKAMLFWGIYESAEARFVQRYLSADRDVIELGSSIGVISSLVRRKLRRDKSLICLEMNPLLMAQLTRNVRENSSTENVHFINCAIAQDPTGGAASTYFRPEADNTCSRLSITNNSDELVKVQTTKLSDIIDSYDVQEFSLISDIEGAEASFIFFEPQTLATCRQLIIELHDTWISNRTITASEMRELIEGIGFRLVDGYGNVFAFEKTTDVIYAGL